MASDGCIDGCCGAIFPTMMFDGNRWYPVSRRAPMAIDLFERHYSVPDKPSMRARHLKAGITPPGEALVLMTSCSRALFSWWKGIDHSGQTGVNCQIFRNESGHLSSELILEAEELAWRKWPRERLYTYVNGNKIASVNPGYCFKMAGWKDIGTTKGGLRILEKQFSPA